MLRGHNITFKSQFQLTSKESMGASLFNFFGDVGPTPPLPAFGDYAYECDGYAAGTRVER